MADDFETLTNQVVTHGRRQNLAILKLAGPAARVCQMLLVMAETAEREGDILIAEEIRQLRQSLMDCQEAVAENNSTLWDDISAMNKFYVQELGMYMAEYDNLASAVKKAIALPVK